MITISILLILGAALGAGYLFIGGIVAFIASVLSFLAPLLLPLLIVGILMNATKILLFGMAASLILYMTGGCSAIF